MARISMLLAYSAASPEGDVQDRLELNAPLTPQGQLDETNYQPPPWPALRTLPDGRSRATELVHEENGWALRGVGSADAPLWNFEGNIFRPGEYVHLRRPTGEELVFRIVEVQVEA
jgi:hypothetical protein